MRMVHLTTASSMFHARVVAARLGADGILTELRGPGSTYPVGGVVEVLVASDDEDAARQLLSADETEAALADQVDSAMGAAPFELAAVARQRWVALLTLALALALVWAGLAAHAFS
ncbi:MAG TPA: DUF2007 domain-containing protein [Acidimicrobiales bacterium]|nr:DUF2007 domain-containing protein [Acidimicrobiales bacterium]